MISCSLLLLLTHTMLMLLPPSRLTSLILLPLIALLAIPSANAIKFDLQAEKYPTQSPSSPCQLIRPVPTWNAIFRSA